MKILIQGLWLLIVHISLTGNLLGQPVPADAQPEKYLPLLAGKRVGVAVNHTAQVQGRHLLDILLENQIQVKCIFSPEHGFRGDADAGSKIKSGIDPQSGLRIISLYGDAKKPSKADMDSLDVLVFDIQDVGARFYTYLSTLHYLMKSCAMYDKTLVVLDRPNPNGGKASGFVLQPAFKSFVGIHPIPILHGMTLGELAQMINGEGWLGKGMSCKLEVVPVANYSKTAIWTDFQAPSPNLPNAQSIRLYASLCLFEGTQVSVGRGTPFPFQVIGMPDADDLPFCFTPQSMPGKAAKPLQEGQLCCGFNLTDSLADQGFTSHWLVTMYKASLNKKAFFNSFFEKLAGTKKLREMIVKGKTWKQIDDSWKKEIAQFEKKRQPYLLYPLTTP